MASTQTGQPWLELLGSNNWEGLLDPLDLNLRQLIIRCGDFCQATYDAFNNDKNSKYSGSSRYGKNNFFEKVMLESASNYEVVCFLYATARVSADKEFLHSLSRESWDRESNWMGYIATTTDEVSQRLGRREIYVAWRGTLRTYEWIDVLSAKLQSIKPLSNPQTVTDVSNEQVTHMIKEQERHWLRCWKSDDTSSDSDDDENMPKVMEGWLTIYTSDNPNSPFTKLSARDQLMTKIKQLVEKYKNENLSIIFCGHSLGASLSIVSAFDIAINGITNIPITAFVFGSPQVGNKAFNEMVKKLPNLKILHIRNKIDLIPLYPSSILGYVDTGINLMIDSKKSPSLKDSKNTGDWHNLQAMLHVVAGWNGKDEEFKLMVKRSVALVNKSCEFLKDELFIPGSWWIEKNKGMVIDRNGEWVLAPPIDEDIPVPEY